MNGMHRYSPIKFSNIKWMSQRCDELEKHNNALRNKNSALQKRLTQERKYFGDVTHTLKNEMDELKNVLTELEGEVALLFRHRNVNKTLSFDSNPEMDPIWAYDVAGISYDVAQHNQSDIKMSGGLCNSNYSKLEGQLHRDKNEFLKNMNQNTHQLPRKRQTLQGVPSPMKKMVGRVLSLKSRAKKRSLNLSQAGNNDYFGSSLCSLSSCRDGTVTTETTAEASFSVAHHPPLMPAKKHRLVSSMRWKRADFHSSGLYSGQIDDNSKLPDGFGVFHCFCSDDDCYLKGEWRFGELIQHVDYESAVDDDYHEDKGKHTFLSDGSCRLIQDVQGNTSGRYRGRYNVFTQDLRGTF
ncbi:hypothetical protein HJC23_008359 [Cyclotella cryptica]|uniref:BZIP domain-containing protein n=1 Tax=Cyclotella cryptica TaxID=29204 RepID=A0ABD3Q5R5_9STRA|eukprot:CCRYP_008643-RA/>CCRYP_008643-RA protein AED:0.14 eAED:0.14 QI:0/-1/0/1/-1/1/1/0/352